MMAGTVSEMNGRYKDKDVRADEAIFAYRLTTWK